MLRDGASIWWPTSATLLLNQTCPTTRTGKIVVRKIYCVVRTSHNTIFLTYNTIFFHVQQFSQFVLLCNDDDVFAVPHLELRRHCFTVRVVCKWNSLPSDVVNAPSINAFKSRVDKHWSSREFRYDYKAKFEC